MSREMTAVDTRARRSALLPPGLPPFGVTREQAALLLSISVSLFDSAVEVGTMPQPRVLGGRNIWDVDELWASFRALPHKAGMSRDPDEQRLQGNAFDNAKKA